MTTEEHDELTLALGTFVEQALQRQVDAGATSADVARILIVVASAAGQVSLVTNAPNALAVAALTELAKDDYAHRTADRVRTIVAGAGA